MRPPVVRARLQNVDFIVGLRTVLGFVQCAIRTEIDSLRIAVAVGEDMAPHAFDLWIVVGNRPVEIQPKRLTDVRNVILRFDLRLRRQPLCLDWNAVVAELIVSLVADCVVQLAIRPDLHPPGLVVVSRWQCRHERDWITQRLGRPVVCKAHDLRVEKTIRARFGPRLVRRQTSVGVRVRRVDDVVGQVERQAHQPVLPSRRLHFVDRHRDAQSSNARATARFGQQAVPLDSDAAHIWAARGGRLSTGAPLRHRPVGERAAAHLGPGHRDRVRARCRRPRVHRSRRSIADEHRWLGVARWRVRSRSAIVDGGDESSASHAAPGRASSGMTGQRIAACECGSSRSRKDTKRSYS